MKPSKRRLPLPSNINKDHLSSQHQPLQDKESHEFSQWVNSHRTLNNLNTNRKLPPPIPSLSQRQASLPQNKSMYEKSPTTKLSNFATNNSILKPKPQWNSRLVSNGIPDYDSKKDKFTKPKQATSVLPKVVSPLANATISSQEEAIQRLKQKNIALMKQVDQLKATLEQDTTKKDQIIKTLNDTIYHLEQDLKKKTEIIVTAAAPPPPTVLITEIPPIEESRPTVTSAMLKPSSSQSNDRSTKMIHYLEKEKLENKKLQQNISKLEKQMDQYRQTLEEFISRERKSMEDNSKLREENDTLKESLQTTEQRNVESNETIVSLQRQVVELQKRITNFETTDKKRQTIELEERKQMILITKRITALEKEKSDMEATVDQYKQEYEKHKQNHTVLRNELKERESLCLSLEQQVETLTKQISELATKIKQTPEPSSQEEKLEQTISQLNQQLNDSEERAKQLSETNKILLLRIQKLEER